MTQPKITQHQLFCLLCLFFLGGISYIGGSNEAGRDSWLSFLLGALLFLPVLLCTLALVRGESTVPGVFRRAAATETTRFSSSNTQNRRRPRPPERSNGNSIMTKTA